MNELIQEIEDDIRRERLDRLWSRFGRIMVAASVAVILVTAVIVVAQNRRQARAMERTAQFIKGIDRIDIEDYQGAIAIFDALAADESSPYYGMSMLRKAQAQSGIGDKDGAMKTLQAMAGRDTVFGGLAGMRASGDTVIEPEKHSPFYHTQREWAAWQWLKQGNKDQAVSQLRALRDDDRAPGSLRTRVREVAQHIAPESAMKDEPLERDE